MAPLRPGIIAGPLPVGVICFPRPRSRILLILAVRGRDGVAVAAVVLLLPEAGPGDPPRAFAAPSSMSVKGLE